MIFRFAQNRREKERRDEHYVVRDKAVYVEGSRIGVAKKAKAVKTDGYTRLISIVIDVGGSEMEIDVSNYSVEVLDDRIVLSPKDPKEANIVLIEAKLSELNSVASLVIRESNRIKDLLNRLYRALSEGKISEDTYRDESRKLHAELGRISENCYAIDKQLGELTNAISELLGEIVKEMERLSLNEIYGTINKEDRDRLETLRRFKDRLLSLRSRIMMMRIDLSIACPRHAADA